MTAQLLNYRVDGDGAPVVLLHPVGLDLESWGAIVDRIGPGRSVIRLDHRGHGHSAASEPDASLHDYAADVHETLLKLGVSNTVIVGLSFGGMVAQTLALDFPGDVSRLVVAGCPSTFPDDNVRRLVRERGTAAFDGMDKVIPATLERWFSADFIASGGADATRERLVKDSPREWATAWSAISRLDTLPRLGEIRIPTLCIAGEADPAAPPLVVETIARNIDGALFVVLPGAPHMMQIETPDLFGNAVRAFCDDKPDPRC